MRKTQEIREEKRGVVMDGNVKLNKLEEKNAINVGNRRKER